MIKVLVYGVDNFAAAEISRRLSDTLKVAYETNEDIELINVESSVLDEGFEQNNYRCFVEVLASSKYEVLEETASKVLFGLLKDYVFHIDIMFNYFHDHAIKSYQNDDYPKFAHLSTTVTLDENSEEDGEPYYGDIFKDFSEFRGK